jgi:hypothetical protein
MEEFLLAKKMFTVNEANAILPQVRKELEKMQELGRQFEGAYMELQEMKERAKRSGSGSGRQSGQRSDEPDPFFTMECELEFMQMELRTMLESFNLMGVELKDLESGLIDFPAVIAGEEVLLCWRQGEEKVEHYHGLYDGFRGRKKLDE